MSRILDKCLEWIKQHDERNSFVYIYIGSAVILSIAISLFWLIVVVGVHFVFEIIKQYQNDKLVSASIIRAFWELLLDIALIIFSFVLVLYMDVVLGAAGIGVATRAGVQSVSKIGVRFAGFQRAIRGLLLSIDDLLQISKSFIKTGKDDPENDIEKVHKFGGWQTVWGIGDILMIVFLVLSVVFVFAAPYLLDTSYSSVFNNLLSELHPLGK